MPKPQGKHELLTACESEFAALVELIDGLPAEKQNMDFPAAMMNRNVRDVLAHLHHWHVLLLSWYETAEQGGAPQMPTAEHKWSETPALNREINKRYSKQSLKNVRAALQDSHAQIVELINGHSNKQLFTKKHYAWTGSTSLGAYIISNSSSHYGWARKLIKAATK